MALARVRLVILGAAVLLLLGVQIALAQVRVQSGPGVGTTAGASRAQGLATSQITPAVAGVTLQGRTTVVLADGRTAIMPAFKSDTDLTSSPQQGIPAIKPTIRGAGPTVPAFTVADVMRYANVPGATAAAGYASSIPPVVISVEFLTQGALTARIPEADTRGVPSDTLLCYVQYSGKFELTSPFGPPRYYDRAAEVFNAHTGNRLMEGVGPWIR